MAQFNVQLKDGSEYLVDAPEDATYDDLARLISENQRGTPASPTSSTSSLDRIRAEREREKELTARLAEFRGSREEEDEGILGNLIEGFGAGFVGMGESAALGAATLLEEEDELAARETIQKFADSITDDEGDEDSISYGLGQALGSIAGIAAPAALVGAGVAASPFAGAATVAGTGIAGLLGVGAGAGEASERARAADATEEERGSASFRGALIGLTEILPIARFVKYVDVPIVSNLVDKLGPDVVEGIGGRLRNMAVTGGAEGLQEATAEILQNINEQQYNVLAETFEGIGPAAGYGGGAGAIIQGLIDVFVPGKSRKETGDPNDTTVGEALTDQMDVGEEQRLQQEASERLGDPQQDMFALEKEQLLERGFEEPVAEEVTEEVAQETSPAQMDLVDEVEFQELVEEEAAAERAAVEQAAVEQEEADAQAQTIRAESELESITARGVGRQQAESETRRGEILRDVIEKTPTRQQNTLLKQFTNALEAEGITDTQPTEAEFSTIQRAIDFQRAERVEPEMLPSDSDVTEMEAAVAPKERTEIKEQPSFPGMGRAGLTATPTVDEDVEVAQEPTPVTSEVMDGLGISKNALIRKRIEGKDLNDPVVRDDLTTFARKSKSQGVKQNVDRLLSGVPDEQLSLIPSKQETKRLKETEAVTEVAPDVTEAVTEVAPDVTEATTEVAPDVTEATTATLTEAPRNRMQRKLAEVGETTPPEQVAKKKTTAKRVTTKKTTETKQRTRNITAKPKKLTAEQQAEATLQLMQKYKDVEGMKVAEDQNIIQLRDDGYFDPKYLGFETVQDGGFRITFLMDGIPSDATGTSPLTQEDTTKIDTIKNTEKVTKNSLMESLQGFFGSRTNPKVEPLSALYWAIFEDVFHARKYTEGKKKGKFVYPQQFNSTGESEATKKFFKATGRKRAGEVLAWADENMSPKTKQWMENVRRELRAEEAKTQLSLIASDKDDLRRQKASEQDKSIAAAEKTPKTERTDRSNEKLRQDLSNFNTIRKTQVGVVKDVSPTDYIIGKTYSGEALPLPSAIVSALSERFHPVTMALVADGNLKEALESISNTSSNQKVRGIARKLSEFVGSTKIQIAPNLDMAGQFDPKTNTIYINPASGTNTHVVFHEVTHALTSETLANENNPLTKRLNKLFNEVKDSLDTAYGATTLDEFAAEAFSNPDFQKKLAKILLEDGRTATGTNALTRFFNIVARFLNNKLGLNFKTYDDALTESNKIILEILSPAPDSRDAGILAMDNTVPRIKSLMGRVDEVQKGIREELTSQDKEEFKALAKDFLSGKMADNAKTFFLSVLPSQALADVASGMGITGMQDLHVAMETQRGDLSKVDARMDAHLAQIKSWYKGKSEATKKLFADVVYTSTIDQVDPSRPKSFYIRAEEIALDQEAKRIQNSVFKKTKQEISLKEARKQIPQEKLDEIKTQADLDDAEKLTKWDELNSKYKKLDQNGQYTYKFMRNIYKKKWEEMHDVIKGRIDALPLDEEGKAKLKNEVFEQLFAQGDIDPFFPLTRSGDYWLSYQVEGSGETVVETFESVTTRRHAIELLKKEGIVIEKTIQSFRNPEQFSYDMAPSGSFVGQTLRIIDSHATAGLSPEKAAEIKNEITRLFLTALPESSFAKSLKARKGTPGYIEDPVDAMEKKGYDIARQIERMKNTEAINSLMEKIEEDNKATPEGRSDNGLLILAEIKKRADFARNPPKDVVAQNLNRAAFIYTIGFNASSALVNLSQIPLFVLPMFGAKYGYTETIAAIKEAGRFGISSGTTSKGSFDVAFGEGKDRKTGIVRDKSMPAIDNYYEWKNGDFVVREDLELSKELRKEVDNLLPLVKMATERGQLNRSLIADSLNIDVSGRTRSLTDKISAVSAYMFHQAEQINRQTTLIAAYKLEMQQINEKAKDGKNPESKMTTAEKQQLASTNALYATQETNGGAVLETGPRLSQNGWLRVAMMYKNFGLQMYYSMLKSAKIALDADFSPEERKIARKQLYGVHGTALFFAGVSGVPLYGAVSMLADMLFLDEEEEDFDTIVRQYIGEEWYKGGLTSMLDIDVSQRVALTNLLWTANRYNNDASPEESLAHYLGGPAWGVIKSFDRAHNDFMNGELERGIESMVPSAVRNAWKGGVRYIRDDGILTRRGDPILEEFGAGDVLPQILGFPPAEYTRTQEFNQIKKRIDTEVNRKKSSLTKKLYVMYRLGDWDGANEILKEIQKFNKRHPSNAILGDTIKRSIAGHIRTTADMHGGVTISKNMRGPLAEIKPTYVYD